MLLLKIRKLSRWTLRERIFLSVETITQSIRQLLSFANHCGKHFLISEEVYMSISAVIIMILGGWFCRKFIMKFLPTLKLMTIIEVSVGISCVLGYILLRTISIRIFPDVKLRKKMHEMIAYINGVKSLLKSLSSIFYFSGIENGCRGGYYLFLLNQCTSRSAACHSNICMELVESATAKCVNAALVLFTMPAFMSIKKTHYMSLEIHISPLENAYSRTSDNLH